MVRPRIHGPPRFDAFSIASDAEGRIILKATVMKEIAADDNSPNSPPAEKHRWLRKLYKTAGTLSILGGGGVVLHTILTRRERKRFRPAGRMIEVKSRLMHMLAMGDGALR
jgi:hypothetical protein